MSERGKDALIGSVLGGRYEIITFIDQGGMGSIYRAKDRRISSRAVAVKFLHERLDQASVERFLQEAHATARINHPNIIQVYDTGVTDAGTHYFVMEFLRGRNLTSVLENTTKKRLPWSRLRRIAVQVCDALQAAHDVGVIHRDLKPQNIFSLDKRNDFVKVLDFGIAKLVSETTLNDLTNPRDVLGTVRYLAPETIRGKNIGPGVDIYALGVVLYQALLGDYPLQARSLPEFLEAINREVPRSLSERDPTLVVPPQVDQAILRALDKDPSERYPSMSAFRDALLSNSPHSLRPKRTLQFVPGKRSNKPPPPPARRRSSQANLQPQKWTLPASKKPSLPTPDRDLDSSPTIVAPKKKSHSRFPLPIPTSSQKSRVQTGHLGESPKKKAHPRFPLPLPASSQKSRVQTGTLGESPRRKLQHPVPPVPTSTSRAQSGTLDDLPATRQWKPQVRAEELEKTIPHQSSRPRSETVQTPEPAVPSPPIRPNLGTVQAPHRLAAKGAQPCPKKPQPQTKRTNVNVDFWREVRVAFARKNIPKVFLAASLVASIITSAALTTILANEVSAKNSTAVEDLDEFEELQPPPTPQEPKRADASDRDGARDGTSPPASTTQGATETGDVGETTGSPDDDDCSPFCDEGTKIEVVSNTLAIETFNKVMAQKRRRLKQRCKEYIYIGANRARVSVTVSGKTGKATKVKTDISTASELGNCIEGWLPRHLKFHQFEVEAVTYGYSYTFEVE